MTSRTDAYTEKLSVITSIARADTMAPSMPVDTYVQEANDLYHWCRDDRDALVHVGLDWSVVEDLPIRADAAGEAQSIWITAASTRERAQKQWAAAARPAYELRDELVHHMRFAFRKRSDLSAAVKSTAAGRGDANMIQDLIDLAVMGRSHLDLLTAVGFDPSELDRAAALSNELGSLKAEASVERANDPEKKLIRDKAYTHLKEAVDRIRECGRFAFRKNPERAHGYAGEYTRKKNARRKLRDKQDTPPID